MWLLILYIIGLTLNFISLFELYFSDEDYDTYIILGICSILIPLSSSLIFMLVKLIEKLKIN